MENCSIHISAYHDYAGIDWDLKKVDGEWQRARTGGKTWDEGRRWTFGENAVAESMIDNLVAIAIAKIDAALESFEDGDTIATDERDGITVDIIFNREA